MKALKDYVRERELRQSGGMPENAPFHSKSYRRHFEGYSEYREKDSNGTVHIRRVYTGVWHQQKLSRPQRLRLRLFYIFFYVLSAVLFGLSVSRPVTANASWYIAAPQAMVVVGFLWLLYALVGYLTAPEKMTLADYRSVASLCSALRFVSAGLLICAVLVAGHAFIPARSHLVAQLICCLLLLASAGCLMLILRRENSIIYDSFLSEQQAPPDSWQISL